MSEQHLSRLVAVHHFSAEDHWAVISSASTETDCKGPN